MSPSYMESSSWGHICIWPTGASSPAAILPLGAAGPLLHAALALGVDLEITKEDGSAKSNFLRG